MENRDQYNPNLTAKMADAYSFLIDIKRDIVDLDERTVIHIDWVSKRRSKAKESVENIPENVAEHLDPKPRDLYDHIESFCSRFKDS